MAGSYEFHTKVVGVTFDGRQRYIRHMREGETVTLVREASNPYDRNAIQVINSLQQQIGFISKDLAAKMAPKMDAGIPYSAKVTNITANNPGDPVGVNLLIREG